MSSVDTLRVIDFGRVSGLRSQTLWHAIAKGVSRGAPPTLSFMDPSEPYVSIGYHRSTSELDPRVCGDGGLAVYRRMVGGGPVYIDEGQHFFQIVLPLDMAPARRGDAVRVLLEPAVWAFNDMGIDATLDEHNEVVLGDRKICGHAAGQIEGAVVVVGNLINSFDHTAAASIANTPTEVAREEFLTQMRRFVAATPTDAAGFNSAAVSRYGEALRLSPVHGTLGDDELQDLEEFDARFVDPEWVNAVDRPANGTWRVKVKSGVWVGSAASNGHRVTASFREGEIDSVHVEGPGETFSGMDELLSEMASNAPV